MTRTGLTRRDWAVALTAVPLLAQVASTPQRVTSAGPSVASAAEDDVRKVSERLAQIEVPMSVEPAFAFHV